MKKISSAFAICAIIAAIWMFQSTEKTAEQIPPGPFGITVVK